MLQGLNAADSIVGAPGDVMCLNETGKVVYVIEVKDRTLTLSDVRSSTGKARALTDPLETCSLSSRYSKRRKGSGSREHRNRMAIRPEY